LDGKTVTGEFDAIEQEQWESGLEVSPLDMALSSTSIETIATSTVIDPIVEKAFKNRWIQHLCLQEDGISDPEGL
jgi:hypothetical protein